MTSTHAPVLLAVLGLAFSDGATLTWSGLGLDSDVLTGANWTSGIAPAASGDALIFTGSLRLSPTLAANRSVASITFNSSASSFVLGGTGVYTLTASGGIANSSVSNVQTINNSLVLANSQTWSTNAGTLVLNGGINNSGNLLKISNSGVTTLNGIIVGSGGFTKAGSGTVVLNGANTYSGLNTLGAGNVQIGNDSALGTGSIRFNSTSLNLSATGGDRTLANVYTVDRNLSFSGTNDLTLAGAGTLSGSRTITVNGTGLINLSGVMTGSSRTLTKAGSGALVLSGNNAIKSVKLNAGTLYIGQAGSVGTGLLTLGTGNFGATNTLVLSNAVALAGNTTFLGSSEITFNGATSLSATHSLTFNGSAPVNFNGVISGAGGLTKSGSGTLTIGGTSANTFTGLAKINDGLLTLGKTAGLNAFAGALEIGDGTGSAASAVVQLSASNQIPDTSAVTLFSDGQLKLQSFSDTIGAVTLNGGSVVTGTGVLSLGGNLTFSGTSGATSYISAGLAMTGNRTFLINSNGLTGVDMAISGAITGAFSATKTGVGTLNLSGTNTFSGGYLANAGTTILGNSSALGSSAANLGDTAGTNSSSLLFDTGTGLTVANAITARSGNTGTSSLGGWNTSGANTFSGALTLNKSVTFTAATGGEVAFTGAISGVGGFTKTGGGTVRLSGANTSSGAMLISAGTLALGANGALGSGPLTVDGGVLDFGANHTASTGAVVLDNGDSIIGSGTSTLTSSGNYDVRSGLVQITLAGAGNLTKATTGNVTLSGVSTYSGSTTISAGSLISGVANALPTGTALSISSGANLALQNFSTQVGSVAGAGDILLGSATFTAGGNNSTTTYSGILSGTGGLTKSGSGNLTISGSNSYLGATNLNGGTLTLGKSNALNSLSALTLGASTVFNPGTFSQTVGGLSGSGSVTMGGGTFNIGAADLSTTFSGIISGNGALVKSGSGTLTLSGTNTATSTFEVSAGTVALSGASGSFASAPSVTLQSGSTLSLDNSVSENANRIGNSTAIRLGGGTLQLISDSNGTSESVGALTVLGGSSNVNVTHNGSGSDSSALTFSGLGTITDGATVNFSATGGMLGGSSTGPQIRITGQASGLLGSWATVGADPAEYFLYGIRAYSAYYEGSLGINLNDATKIVRLSAGSSAGAGVLSNAGVTTNLGLNLTDFGNLDLGTDSSRTLNLKDGSLIKSTGVASTIQGSGILTAGGTAAGNLNVSVTSGAGLTINSVIANNTGGTVGLTKSDLGTLTLGGANTFTGGVFVNGGILKISAENNLGSGTKNVMFNGGMLQVTNGFNAGSSTAFRVAAGLSGTLDVLASQTLTLANSAGMLSTGDTASTLIKTGAGSVVIQNANAGFTGIQRIDQGTVELRNSASLGSGIVQATGGTLSLAQDTSTSFGNSVTMLADSTIRVSRLTGTGAVTHTLAGLDLDSRILTVTGDGQAALQISNITLSGTGTLNLTTADLRAGAITGFYDLTKSGNASLILTAANNYIGSTVINGGTLSLGLANVIPDGSAVTLASGTTFNLGNFSDTIGSLAGSGNVSLGTATLTSGTAGSTTFSGIISGTGGLTKSGTTTLTLSGANTYTGPTLVSSGTLAMGGANRLDSGTALTVSSGTNFLLNGNATTTASLAGGGTIGLGSGILTTGTNSSTFSGVITGTGGLTKSGSGILTLGGNSTFSGNTAIQGGGITLTSATALGGTAGTVSLTSGAVLSLENNISVGTKALSLTGSGTSNGGALVNNSGTNSWSGNVTLAGASTVTSNSGSLTLSGAANLGGSLLTINGSAGITLSGVVSGTSAASSTALTKSGTGTLVLSGANTYSGVTNVSSGILQIDNTAALGATGSGHGTVIASGATLLLQPVSGLAIGNEFLTLDGSGSGGIGALRSQSGDNGWSGPVILAGDSTLQVDTGSILTLSGSISESGGTRSLTKIGGGVLTLSGSASNTGPLLVQNGTLQIGASQRLGDTSLVNVSSGATFDLDDNDETIGSLVGAGSVTLGSDVDAGGGDLTVGGDNSSSTFSGIISGLGSIVKIGAGTQTLSGSSTYTGVTTVGEGILSVATLANGGTNSGIGASASDAANLVLDGGTLRYTGAAQSTNRDFTIDTGGGTFDASGTGALTLAGTATVAGTDTARTLTLTGSNTGSNTLTGALTDNGTGKTSLVKSGTGTWVLGGANAYTGSTTVTGGILRISSSNRIADLSAVVVSSGATFDFNGNSDTIGSLAGTGNVTLGNGAMTTGADNSSTTFGGIISGTGPVTKSGGGIQIFFGANNYTGVTTISGGTLSVATLANGGTNSGVGASSNSAANLVLNGGTLRYTGATQSTDRNYTIGIAGGGFDASGSGPLTLSGAATFLGNNTARTVTLSGTNTGNNTLSASLADNGNGKTSLVKTDSGTWVVGGSNSYTGTTTISGGTLAISPTGSLGATTTTIATGATLQNNGIIAGAVTTNGTLTGQGFFSGTVTINGIQSSGVNAGAGSGIQTFSNGLIYSSTSIVSWQLDENTASLGLAGADYDQMRVTGGVLRVDPGASLNLLFNLSGSNVSFSNSFWTTNRSWAVASLSGTGTANVGNASFSLGSISLDSLGQSYQPYGTFSSSISSGTETLNWTAVPEPHLAGLLLLGSSVLLRRRRA
ncbi:MAG: autotransporter-associated beta strand repeat-containing protein [Luteolibacter sp.]